MKFTNQRINCRHNFFQITQLTFQRVCQIKKQINSKINRNQILLLLEIQAYLQTTLPSFQFTYQSHSNRLFTLTTMSLENSFFSGNSSSPNIIQTYNIKNFNDYINQSSISKKQTSYKTEAMTFIKTSLNHMIKDQLKSYRLQKKLQKELHQFNKTKQTKQLVADLHKIQKFRQKQSEVLRTRLEQYHQQKKKKDSIASSVIEMKKQISRKKKQQNDRKIQEVRKRFFQNQNQDIQNRLSRADSVMSHKSVQSKQNTQTARPRNIYTSLNQRRFFHHPTDDEQKKRITNYLRKIKHAQSRIIEKDLRNQERKQNSIKSQIKNLTKQRNQKEQDLMKQWQLRLESKMGSFYQNLTRSQFENSTLMMNRSRIKQQLRVKVMKNKETNDSQLVNKTLDNFMRKKADKQNLYRNHQRKIDLLRTKSSFMNNTIQIHRQQLDKQNEKNIKVLYQTMNKIKNLKPNETLSEKEKESIMSFLDSQDPLYAEMTQFLSNTKSEFLKKKIQKDQEKIKMEKTKKTTRFNNKN